MRTTYKVKQSELGKSRVNTFKAAETQQFDFVLDTIDEGIVLSDDQRRFVYVNTAFCAMTGYSESKLLGMTPFDITPPEYHDQMRERLALRAQGRDTELLVEIIASSGVRVPVKVHAVAQKQAGGDAELAVITNLSVQRSIEHELAYKERELRSMIDHVQGFFYRCRIDRDWTMFFLSQGCFDITGYEPSEVLNNSLISYNQIIAPEFREQVREDWERVYKKGAVYEGEYPIVRKNGERRWVWERGWLVEEGDENGNPCLEGFIADITERRTIENQLKESENRYRKLFDSLHDAAIVLDLEYTIMQANPRAALYAGYESPEALVGTSCFAFLPEHFKDYMLERFDELIGNDMFGDVELVARKKDGTQFPALVSASMLHDDAGEPTGILTVIRDVSAVKKAEKQQMELIEQREENRRWQMLGRLAGGIAHYFNNMLGVIMGYADMLRSSATPESEQYDQLSKILDASTRSADLVRQLLALAGRQAGKPDAVDVSEFITRRRKDYQHLLGDAIQLSCILPEKPVSILIDPGHLDTALTNLFKNARDAIQLEGEVTVRAGTEGQCVYISVNDTGEGMSNDLIMQVCQPFYTTHGELTGAVGLGLSVVQGIAQQYRGSFTLNSRAGDGTTAMLRFPSFDSDGYCLGNSESQIR
jgi:PAS domain S-box-containing protein